MAKAISKKTKAEKLMENIEEVEAKTVDTNDEETVELNVTEEESTPEIAVVVDESATEIENKVRMSRVRVKNKFKCHIGGEWYYFEKNKIYSVPEEVKDILMQADKLLPM